VIQVRFDIFPLRNRSYRTQYIQSAHGNVDGGNQQAQMKEEDATDESFLCWDFLRQ